MHVAHVREEHDDATLVVGALVDEILGTDAADAGEVGLDRRPDVGAIGQRAAVPTMREPAACMVLLEEANALSSRWGIVRQDAPSGWARVAASDQPWHVFVAVVRPSMPTNHCCSFVRCGQIRKLL